jgi:hypothetical protein
VRSGNQSVGAGAGGSCGQLDEPSDDELGVTGGFWSELGGGGFELDELVSPGIAPGSATNSTDEPAVDFAAKASHSL